MTREYYTWSQFNTDVCMLAHIVLSQGGKPNFIIGIARGGSCLATALSYKLDVPVIYYDPKNPVKLPYNSKDKFLIVDDINDTGNTLKSARKLVIQILHPEFTGVDDEIFELSNCRFLTIFNNSNSIFKRNIFVRETKNWIVFPWEEICMEE